MLISVVSFDLFGTWIEGVNFGQTETDPYSEGLNTLDYDSLNILTNMFSVHIFVLILLLQALIGSIVRHYCNCLGNSAVCRRCRSYSVRETVVMGVLRILLTGFLEILLSTIIGIGIFKLDSFTSVDIVTVIVTVGY